MAYIKIDLSLIDDYDLEEEIVKRLSRGNNSNIQEVTLTDDVNFMSEVVATDIDQLSEHHRRNLLYALTGGEIESNMYDNLKREHIESVFDKYNLDELYKLIP